MGKINPKKIFITTAVISLLVLLQGCMKDLFNEELVRGTYADGFPVKDIDPAMDWKMTRALTSYIRVYEDEGVTYTIQVYDNNPLDENVTAHLLTQGVATSENAFTTSFDCPIHLNELYVCRQDEAGRSVVQLAEVTNGMLDVTFGEAPFTRSLTTRAEGYQVPTYTPARSAAEVKSLAASATVIKSNTRMKRGKVYKIPQGDTFRNDFSGEGATVIVEGTWVPGGNIAAIQSGVELIVTSTGKIYLPDSDSKGNRSLQLVGNSFLTIYPGGYVGGKNNTQAGYIYLPNGSDGKMNYNAGTLNINYLEMNGEKGRFCNYGTAHIDQLILTNEGASFINQGQAVIGSTPHVNSTIENGCYLQVTGRLLGHLRMGDNCAATIRTYGQDGNANKEFRLGSNSMITITEEAYFSYGCHVTGPDNGHALFQIGTLKNLNGFSHQGGLVYYEVEREMVDNSWEKSTFLRYLLNSKGTLSRWGESPVVIPSGECTGKGNTPNESGKPTPSDPISYTYVFEDNFPLVGDYDFNDVVIDVVPRYLREERKRNFIQRIQLDITLTAAGASKTIGLGLRLVGIQKSDILSVKAGTGATRFHDSMNNSGSLFTFNRSTLMEDDDPSVVIPIAGSIHQALGLSGNMLVNTGTGATATPVTYSVFIELADKENTSPLFTKDNLDFFICYKYKNLGKRMEVHLYEFWKYGATAAGTVQKANLDVAGNNTWAVCVPYGFRYPKESINISRSEAPDESAYPDFLKWARDRSTCQDWYLRPNEQNVMR